MTEAETIAAQITQLDADIASGSLIVRHGDTLRQARTLAEMKQIRSDLQARLDALTTKRRRVGYLRQSGKGL